MMARFVYDFPDHWKRTEFVLALNAYNVPALEVFTPGRTQAAIYIDEDERERVDAIARQYGWK